jgi:hypothetical protein
MGARLRDTLARRRVTLGFLFAAIVMVLATPTWPSMAMGAAVASLGEAIRLWAAGHVEKGREVTSSGPYRYWRHPLYIGSCLIGAGVAVAANHLAVAAIVGAYLVTTIVAAISAEEAHLRAKFGDAYDAYVRGESAPGSRAFSIDRALRNREHHAIAGLAGAFAMFALKILWLSPGV